MTSPRIEISPDKAALATALAEFIVARFAASDGPFALNLSGGSTPKALYELLAADAYREKFDWGRVHVFFGDERFVPFDHPDSNYRMARESLLAHVPIPEANIYPVQTESGAPEEAAAAYEATLKAYYGADTLDPARPLFQVTLLGLGDDGHTASLFPGTEVLREREKWVASVIGAKPEPRITMTYPVLASSAAAAFMVAGAGKKPMLDRLIARDPAIPSAHVEPTGALYVFCDAAAKGDA